MRKERRRKLHSSGIQASLSLWHRPEIEAVRGGEIGGKNKRKGNDVHRDQVEAWKSSRRNRSKDRKILKRRDVESGK